MKSRPRELCIVCEFKINHSTNKKSKKLRRGPNAITCSKKCSRVYVRISNHIIGGISRKNKKKWKKKKQQQV